MSAPLVTAWTGLLDLLAPPTCPGCALHYQPAGDAAKEQPEAAAAFCPACAPLLDPAPPEARPPAQHAAAYLYQGPLADAIRRFKYDNQSALQRGLAPLLTTAAAAYAGQVDAVVPVPLHPSKLRRRGWNPAALLARPVSRCLAVPLRCSWLRRTRETAVQAGLSRERRLHNVRGAFQAGPATPARVLLVDDVRTTGATLLEASNCLAERGHSVITLALAWSLQDLP